MFKWFWEKRLKMWVRQNVRQTEIKWKIGGTTLRGGINLQLSPAAAFCCFLPTAETFDNSCKFTFGFLPTFKCDPCGMQAEVGMAGSTIYCIFSAGLSRDVSVAFRSMSKISFTSFLSCLAFFSVSCAENDIKIAQHCFKKYFTFLKRKRKNPNHCHSHSHHGGLVENSLVRITRSNLPNPSISPSTNQR